MCLFSCFLKRRSVRGLTQPSIGVTAHLHPDRLQHLFHTHVTIPIAHGGDLVHIDITRLAVDAVHVDLGDELDLRGDAGIIVRTVQTEFVKTIRVLRLRDNDPK